MLRINLLPIRQLKKRAEARAQILSFSTLLVFLLLILGTIAVFQASTAKSIQASLTSMEREKQQYAPILAQIAALEKEKKEVEDKIAIIHKLKMESSLTVHVLDEVASKLDSKRMWLTALTQEGATLSLNGVALDNQTIAEYMKVLSHSPYVSSVDLANLSSTLDIVNPLLKKAVEGRNLKNFTLTCAVALPKTDETKQQKK